MPGINSPELGTMREENQAGPTTMTRNDHFESVADWTAAVKLIDFEPRRPAYTAGFALSSLSVHVMDSKKRRIPVGARSLEAHYGGFVIAQQQAPSTNEAQRRAQSTAYGQAATTVRVAGHEGRSYGLGPTPAPEDIDGRAPGVVVWNDGAMFCLVASDQLDEEVLLRIANSMYA